MSRRERRAEKTVGRRSARAAAKSKEAIARPPPPPLTEEERSAFRRGVALIALSAVFLAVRGYAARVVGFGDAEALYASYALHPQPAYLDHPGLVGILARAIGGGLAPRPEDAHRVTGLLATLAPWVLVLVARSLGAARHAAVAAGLVVATVPELAIGLFGMTPDLLLYFAFLGAVGMAAVGLSEAPGTLRASGALVSAGALAGVAGASKVTGLLLFPALVFVYLADPAAKRHARTPWPWAGLSAGLVVLVPVLQHQVAHGWPMLRHRLVDTQAGAGASLRNLGALVGGQLVYVSPLLFATAVALFVDLLRRRREDTVTRLLFAASAFPLAALLPLCLWSRVAEPHWLAPALLPLPLHAARRAGAAIGWGARLVGRRFLAAGAALGLVASLAVHAWVLVPSLLRFAPASYDPKLDIANELFGWPAATEGVREVVGEGLRTTVVGPHWVICAQLEATLGAPGTARVGCLTEIGDDWSSWNPRERWEKDDRVVFVTDERFPVDPAGLFPDRNVTSVRNVATFRGGRRVRTFTITVLDRAARARR